MSKPYTYHIYEIATKKEIIKRSYAECIAFLGRKATMETWKDPSYDITQHYGMGRRDRKGELKIYKFK